MLTSTALLALLLVGEGVARFGLGFGDPPLFDAHPEVEYLARPSSRYRRFGNVIAINAWGMRGPDFPRTRASPEELRVMVLGDSVVYGGHHLDQGEVLSEVLRERIAAGRAGPIVVGNIAAPSWGPRNLLAYLERYGAFGADAVAVVLSEHDLEDQPAPAPPHPAQAPLFALEDLMRAVLRRAAPLPPPPPPREREGVVAANLDITGRLLDLLGSDGRRVVLVLHRARAELDGPLPAGLAAFSHVAEERGIAVIDAGPALRADLAAGRAPYHDELHPSAEGAALLAALIAEALGS